MKICIVSDDLRFKAVNEKLNRAGHASSICLPDTLDECEVLLFSIKDELSDSELKTALSKIDESTLVICGKSDRVKKYFGGRVVSYFENEELTLNNAHLTAEATLSLIHRETKESVSGKKILVTGYGRIGKRLCEILSHIGADVFVYARRETVKKEVELDGFGLAELKEAARMDMIINTVPAIIFGKDLTDELSPRTVKIELASAPGGFENKVGVISGSALPSKILTESAANIIYGDIQSILQCEKGHN